VPPAEPPFAVVRRRAGALVAVIIVVLRRYGRFQRPNQFGNWVIRRLQIDSALLTIDGALDHARAA